MSSFTHSPPLHRNFLIGSLQLLAWLLWHPAAWRSYVARCDPNLRPDFALAELSRAQWRQAWVWRLLVSYWVWAGLIGLVVAAVWVSRGVSGRDLLFWVSVSLVFGFATSIPVAIAANVAVGYILFCVVSLTTGIVVVQFNNNFEFAILLIILATGYAGNIAGTVPSLQTHSRGQQALGILVGIVIGLGVIIIGAGAGLSLTLVMNANLSTAPFVGVIEDTGYALMVGVAGAVTGGVAFGVRRANWREGAALAGLVGLVFGALSGLLNNNLGSTLASVLLMSLVIAAMFALPYLLADRIGGAWAGALAGALSGGAAGFSLAQMGETNRYVLFFVLLLSVPFILGAHWVGAFIFYPAFAIWNLLLLRLDEQRAAGQPLLLRWHSAFWHEHQFLPLVGLDEYLVLAHQRNPAEARAALEFLLTTRQRWAAQAAQIELDARRLEQCPDAPALAGVYRTLGAGELAGPISALLRSFSRLSQDIDAALQQESAYNQRLALSAVEDRLDGLIRELTRSSERYAARFRPIAVQWRAQISEHLKALAEAVEQRQEIDSPYVIGVPLTDQQEIFVGRTDISTRIEQLLLDRRRPPLLLYGQRRMGKTSLLNNLGRLLPSTIIPLFVDLQGPASRASDHAGLLYNLARGMSDSAMRQRQMAFPALTREALAADPFTRFDEWLDEVERTLRDHTALLALDEFEVLDQALGEGRFHEGDVMGMLRHLIQHRSRFKVLLAGSHTLAEVQRWASYLINVQVVQIGYLSETEARQLVERPVQGFALRYDPEATARVLALTHGHPFLTQLLCAEIVALKNEQPPATRRHATLADVAAALPLALEHGSFFFADIERNQVDAAARAVLRYLAGQGEGAVLAREALTAHCPGDIELALTQLLRRDLLEQRAAGYGFQVELVRRWFVRG